tara:strand:+ start:11735 stop:13324 length:1590 start_codon:yes stop_codon:yes gene_type:complete
MSTKKTSLQLLESVWLDINRSSTLEESLSTGNMAGFLLTEANPGAAIKSINDALDAAKQEIEAFKNSITSSGLDTPKIVSALGTASAEVAKTRLEKGFFGGDKFSMKKLASPLSRATRITADIQNLMGSTTNAINAVAKGLGDLGEVENNENREKTITQLVDAWASKEDNKDKGIDSKTFEQGISKNLNPPKGLFGGIGQAFKGFIGKLMGKGDLGFGLQRNDVVKELMASKFGAFNKFLSDEQAEDAATASPDDPLQQLTTSADEMGVASDALANAAETGGATPSEDAPASDVQKPSLKALSQELKDAAKEKNIEGADSVIDSILGKLKDAEIIGESYELENLLRPNSLKLLLEEAQEEVKSISANKILTSVKDAIKDKTSAAWLAWKIYSTLSENGIDIDGEVAKPGDAAESGDSADETTPSEEAEIKDVSSKVGTGPLSKDDLALMLKRYPDIVGSGSKARKARKAFRKVVNNAAGKTVFEENRDYSPNQVKLIVEKLINQNENTSPTWSEDEMVVYRWQKMAGLK